MHLGPMMRLSQISLIVAIGLAASTYFHIRQQANPAQSEWSQAGWHYRFDANQDRGAAIYRFGRNSSSYFIALCDRKPILILSYEGRLPPSDIFSFVVDSRVWRFPIDRSGDVGGLLIDDDAVANLLTHAPQAITFSVGRMWTMHVPPSPLLGRLITECRRRNGLTSSRP